MIFSKSNQMELQQAFRYVLQRKLILYTFLLILYLN